MYCMYIPGFIVTSADISQLHTLVWFYFVGGISNENAT